MGRKGAPQRPKGSVTAPLFCRVSPITAKWLDDVADEHATSVGRLLDHIAKVALERSAKKNA